MQTALTHSSIVPFRCLPVVGDDCGDGDEHPADTAMANMAINPSADIDGKLARPARTLWAGVMWGDDTLWLAIHRAEPTIRQTAMSHL